MAADPMQNAGASLRRTPLHALHAELGAKVCPFAGYEMPINYPLGVLKEHLHVREAAGLFDVSHMGQFELRPRSGDFADGARALERLAPIDVLGLPDGRQRYGVFTSGAGGILDDLMVARLGDRLILVVNAANKAADEAHLRALNDACEVLVLDRALIALQGPGAEVSLARLCPETAAMRFMDFREVEILGARCAVSRSGYTGEDGFEISVPNDRVEEISRALLADDTVRPIGLGARDSLRLEAGLCLHGSDIDTGTTPVEAALTWAIPPVRRRGGAREGGFPGDHKILEQIASRSPPRLRVGLRPEGRAPVRAGAELFAEETGDASIGVVTSGGFGPSLQAPVAMGYVLSGLAEPGRRVFADVRGQRLPVEIAPLPFVPARFKRG